ncbi:Heat stress transcription factor [Seminavis robusta]|uniref:Heat stress transcription factor n=1 Tax=Seminavis robusta TaxID=568900 RepID=A0A9N8DLN2_9STRA|nr:Heat stress transcription factor [Seminavis robusta]|eukprot:Sro224_g091690.1 Heat stress transcription factor (542) ;mRNA; f:76124-77882
MSSQQNPGDEQENQPDERRTREEHQRRGNTNASMAANIPTGRLLSRFPGDENAAAARQALGNQLSSASTFLGDIPPGSSPQARGSTLDPLQVQLLRQRAGLSGATAPTNLNFGGVPYLPDSQQQGFMAAQAQALDGGSSAEAQLREAQANLREANLRLLLAQQRQQQHQQQHSQRLAPQKPAANAGFTSSAAGPQSLHLPHSQVSQAHAAAQPHRDRAAAPAPTADQLLALRGLSGFGAGSAPLPALSLQGNEQYPQLSQFLGANPTGNSALTAALHVQQQHIQGASLRQSIPAAQANPDLSRAQYPQSDRPQPPEDDQPEMKDAEYFELFGFNDEDGVQIINETFPHKLYRMLFEVEKNGQEDIVSFFPHGKAFIVHDPKRFVEEIMPRYFSTSRMSSFQRQLNLYGFQRIDDGPEKGGFVHQYFQKGQRSLCNKIRRQRGRPQGGASQPTSVLHAAATASGASLGAGRGSPQEQVAARGLPSRPGPEVASAAAAAATRASMPQSQQAQAVLQFLLSQQQQQQQQQQNPPGDPNSSDRPR